METTPITLVNSGHAFLGWWFKGTLPHTPLSELRAMGIKDETAAWVLHEQATQATAQSARGAAAAGGVILGHLDKRSPHLWAIRNGIDKWGMLVNLSDAADEQILYVRERLHAESMALGRRIRTIIGNIVTKNSLIDQIEPLLPCMRAPQRSENVPITWAVPLEREAIWTPQA